MSYGRDLPATARFAPILCDLQVSDLAQGCPFGRMTPHCRSTSTGPGGKSISTGVPGSLSDCGKVRKIYTFWLRDFGFGLVLLLFRLRRLVRLAVRLALRALLVTGVRLLAGGLLGRLAAAAIHLLVAVAVLVAVVVARARLAVLVVLARLLLLGRLPRALARLAGLLLALRLLLLDAQAPRDVVLSRRLQDALLAVLAALQVRVILERLAGRKGVARRVVELVDDGARGRGREAGRARGGLLLVVCMVLEYISFFSSTQQPPNLARPS